MGTEIVRLEESSGATPPAADSVLWVTDSVPSSRSAPSIAQPPAHPALDSGGGCSDCGRDVEPLHRLKQDEEVRNFCSSCILLLYKGMYCCLCFVVYEKSVKVSDPGVWLTCTKCQRMSHLACARDHNLCTDSVVFTCGECSMIEKAPIKDSCSITGGMIENGSPPLKKLRLSSDCQISPNESLAAAQVVAFLAVKQAKDAKAKARVLAGTAARAAARAKAALDIAHKVALEEARWKRESFRRFPGVLPGKSRGLPSLSVINAPRVSRADGRVSMPSVPHMHSHLLSHKDQSRKEPTLLRSARFSALYSKMKTFSPNAEAMKSCPSFQNALSRSAVFQKPQAVSVQGAVEQSSLIESEGAIVSASPASILDASSSPDTPRLNSSTQSGSAHVGIPESMSKTNSSDTVLTSSQLPVAKDQPVIIEKGAKEASISAP